MKTTWMLANGFGIVSLAIALAETNSSASEPRAVLSPRSLPLVSSDAKKMPGGSQPVMSLGSLKEKEQGRRPSRPVGHMLNLTHGKVNPDAPGQNTIPHWSDSFVYNGLVYNYTMVGTDPNRGSATTVIPTVLIPIRFVFADGHVFDASTDIIDGQTPVQGIINSPIFQNYNFNSVGVNVGNTQWGDAFQRANFWDSVSTRSPNYHVLVGQPTVLPVQTINVPDGLFSYYNDPLTGESLPLVDNEFLANTTISILVAANISPTTLPIIVWGIVVAPDYGGFHGAANFSGNALQTFIATGGYYPHPPIADVYVLSHEIVEWMDDPFGNNFTPGWDFPFVSTDQRCDSSSDSSFFPIYDRLEVADPVAIFEESSVALPGETFTYHVTEAMFLDFYTRSSRSRSYNGQYSFFEIGLPYGLLTGPSALCTGHVEFTPTFVDFPGARSTTVFGINNRGIAVGAYFDAHSAQHGFVFNGSTYSTLDYPGSVQTDADKVNDSGMIVGTFTDASGVHHGFSYNAGAWTQIDFPGASDTEVFGVNSSGAMVGTYDGYQPITHGFLLQNGRYQDIANPFGTQTNLFAINDAGSITGFGVTDPSAGPFTSFILSRGTFSPFQFPGSVFSRLSSINNGNDLAGRFVDPDGNHWGMVTVNGFPYQVLADNVLGNNDLQQICGRTFDQRGFIGTLPLQQNQH
jgi:hypothetical protein